MRCAWRLEFELGAVPVGAIARIRVSRYVVSARNFISSAAPVFLFLIEDKDARSRVIGYE